jgi:hypothetical protein
MITRRRKITLLGNISAVDCSCVLVVDFLAADPEVPGSIPDAARFSE